MQTEIRYHLTTSTHLLRRMNQANLLAFDWGSTNLRGYLLDAEGAILDSRASSHGILSVTDGRFAEALQQHFGDWLAQYPQLPLIASGMIGSRQGWREAPYVPTPVDQTKLAQHLIRIDDLAGRPFAIIPGVEHTRADQVPDVMRGEETQLFGALALLDKQDGIFILPGTHSKWVDVSGGAIRGLHTYMTGELYSILSKHSIIGKLFPDDPKTSLSGFMHGLAQTQLQQRNLSHLLFSARTLGLFGQVIPADLPGYLSGLLISSEISDGLSSIGDRAITLVGTGQITTLYRQALAARGYRATVAPESATAYGFHLLAGGIQW